MDFKVLSTNPMLPPTIWNPCGLGNVSELQSKFYNSAIYAEPHYAKHCERALLRAFQELEGEKPEGFSLKHLIRQLEILSDNGRDKNIEGLFLDLHNLAEGEWGPVLSGTDPSSHTRNAELLSLWDIVCNNKILFVSLPTEAKAVQSQRVGRLILQELMLVSGLLKSLPDDPKRLPFSVYVDEFDAFATPSFATFLNKGRSANLMIHMAHQTLSDLRKIDEHFTGQIMGNCNVRFVFRQDDPDDAEKWSRFFGTSKTLKRTHRTDGGSRSGEGSEREVREFRISPDTIKELPIGTCVYSVKSEKQLSKLRIPRPPKKLKYQIFEDPSDVNYQPTERGLGFTKKEIEKPKLKLADQILAK